MHASVFDPKGSLAFIEPPFLELSGILPVSFLLRYNLPVALRP